MDLIKNTNFEIVKNQLLNDLTGNMEHHLYALGVFANVGVLWFLLALFWCRLFFNLFYSVTERVYVNRIIMVTVALLATLLCQYTYLPFSLLQGLSAMLFYYVGFAVRKTNIVEKKLPFYLVLLMGMIWIYCIIYGNLDMAFCSYNFFILNVLGAISGCYFIYLISNHIDKKWKGLNLLSLFGQLSLVVFCFHKLEIFIPLRAIIAKVFVLCNIQLSVGLFEFLFIITRLVYIGFIVWFVPKITLFRRIFSINSLYGRSFSCNT